MTTIMGEAARGTEPTIWVDCEDLIDYFQYNPHPSGVQRVASALVRALIEMLGPDRVRTVRHGAGSTVDAVEWERIEAMMATAPMTAQGRTGHDDPDEAKRTRIQRAILRLPLELRGPLFRAGVLQSQVLRSLRALARAGLAQPAALREVPTAAAGPQPRPGDLFLVVGAPWASPGSVPLVRRLHAAGVRVGLLIHDLIPLRRPDWVSHGLTTRFRAWIDGALPCCAAVFTLSQFVADDVGRFCAEGGLAEPPARHVVPPGRQAPGGADARPPGLPPPGSYVLYVSTLEARKNHALAVRVWHRLMAEVEAGVRRGGTVPTLVFAGRVGHGVADLLQQLDNSRWLSGRVRLLRDPLDAEVRALVEGCRFTLLPSFYEGWGLPLQESLLLGRPCLAAGNTALRESGGALCRYFDPEDANDAFRAVRTVLDEPGLLETWRDEVAGRMAPRSWREAAAAMVDALVGAPA